MDDLERNESIYIQLADYFSQKHNVKLQWEDIADAIEIHTNLLEHPVDIWNIELSFEELKLILSNYDFNIPKIKVDIDIQLPENILHNVKVRIKAKGNIYIIHKKDLDPFPSNPHAHIYGQCLKLDLSNGNLYRKKLLVEKIPKKEFLLIRSKITEVYKGELPKLCL